MAWMTPVSTRAARCPTLVRTGEGDFHEGLAVHFGDVVPKAAGDNVLYSHALIRRDNNDWAPRIGLAWQVTPRTTVRTGYGVYYGQDTGNPVFDMGRNLGFRDSAFSADAIPNSNLDAPWANKAGGAVQCSNWDWPLRRRVVHFPQRPGAPHTLRAAIHAQFPAAAE